MPHLAMNINIKASAGKIINYTFNPKEWSHWFVNLSGPYKLSGYGEAGTAGDFSYSLFGVDYPMIIEVTEIMARTDRYLWRGNFNGRIYGNLLCRYEMKDGCTEVVFEIDYETPADIAGEAINECLIHKLMANALKATLENLKAICEIL